MTCSSLTKRMALSAVMFLTSSTNSVLAEPSSIENLTAPGRLTPKQFADHQTLITPAADEAPWAKIYWHASVWKARQKAAAEGKPILIWSGGGSPPLGVC